MSGDAWQPKELRLQLKRLATWLKIAGNNDAPAGTEAPSG